MQIKIELDDRTDESVIILSITHNNYQWTSLRLYNQDEIELVIKTLQEYNEKTKNKSNKIT